MKEIGFVECLTRPVHAKALIEILARTVLVQGAVAPPEVPDVVVAPRPVVHQNPADRVARFRDVSLHVTGARRTGYHPGVSPVVDTKGARP